MKFGYIPRKRSDKSKLWNAIYRLIYRLFGRPEFIRKLQAPLIFNFLKLQKGDKIVDLACGNAHFAYEIGQRGNFVIATDIKLHKEMMPKDSFPNLYLIQSDARYLPIRSKSIDKILMSSFLQMIEEDELVLKECYRILKEDGFIVLSVPTNYLYIPKLYHSNWICCKVRKILNLPKKYEMLLSGLNHFFGVTGKGYYSLHNLKRLINQQGLDMEQYEYCPNKIGSFIFEFFLLLRYSNPAKRKIFWTIMFVFFPLEIIDRIFFKENKGCEIILKAHKI